MDRVRVMIVDDNPADSRLVAKLLAEREASPQLQLETFGSAEEALAFLRGEGPGAGTGDGANGTSGEGVDTAPRLVLLDLALPVMSGIQFVTEVRRDARLASLPIVVLSSSDAPHDVEAAYDAGANAYLQKPVDLAGTRELVAAIDGFWLASCRLPEMLA